MLKKTILFKEKKLIFNLDFIIGMLLQHLLHRQVFFIKTYQLKQLNNYKKNIWHKQNHGQQEEDGGYLFMEKKYEKNRFFYISFHSYFLAGYEN